MSILKKIIPFLNEEELDDLLTKVLNSENLVYEDITLKNILPYLNEEDLDQIFVNQLKAGKDIKIFLPFVSQQTLKNIVELYCFDKLDYEIDVSLFANYLDDDSISLLYKKLTK